MEEENGVRETELVDFALFEVKSECVWGVERSVREACVP